MSDELQVPGGLSREYFANRAALAAAEADELEPRRKASLGELLHLLKVADDAVLDLDLDLDDLVAKLRDKVDGVTEYLDYCRARADANAKRAAELSAKASAFRNRANSLEEYVARHMVATETDLIPGHGFQFRVRWSERLETTREPGPGDYLKFGEDAVKREYSWKLNPLKKALKAGSDAVKAFASLKQYPNLEIKPKA